MIKKLFYTFSTISNPYKVLGINKGASQQEFKQAYYNQAQHCPPDNNSQKDAAIMFTQVNNAYEIRQDDVIMFLNKRKIYDTCDNSNDQDFKDELRGNSNCYQQKARRKQSKGKYYSKFHLAEYKSIFNEFDQFLHQKHGIKRAYYEKKKIDDIQLEFKLSFPDTVFGGKHKLQQRVQKSCETYNRCVSGQSA
ncbi:unnamed protein product (macronuclear) [Paramecium tetraurelia]|uniref:J domain-containing protein n=1 Tax=Paramecium tetraurelia TaxID=5888 RepID=A0EA20_PARTE|nr:uncharacterized protein GSPATT00024869001 [Paramecium tetraurelia]CAK92137.1 unnamed protein product [Paramecium tetraurelia]|eukprot:XP_001459534.1 hypothetical protein (macronuclear) [Paramecium tetraurelia strain d4-2]